MSTVKKRRKLTAGEKRRLSALPETAEECAEWLELAVKNRRITSESMHALADDFLPTRDIPLTPAAKKRRYSSEDELQHLQAISAVLSSRVVDWGKKAKAQWCTEVRKLQQADPVAARVRKMNDECKYQFTQLKKIYAILSNPHEPTLRIVYREKHHLLEVNHLLEVTLFPSEDDYSQLLRLISTPDDAVNPFKLGELKKVMRIKVQTNDDNKNASSLVVLGASGTRSGSVQFNQAISHVVGNPPCMSITVRQILDAGWIRTLLTLPGILENNLDLIAHYLSNIKDLAHIVVFQFLLPLHLYKL